MGRGEFGGLFEETSSAIGGEGNALLDNVVKCRAMLCMKSVVATPPSIIHPPIKLLA